ncbi:MAG: hypothetical protein KY475_09445 [Planctomycetes bacterium]|nr:hypothetical protein [Planctomycetota bacterium]
MSEYQYVAFRAVDAPVSEKNLEYMERQSSRAEITPWSFDNSYHYGDFRGNALEMLRRGYDVHLHYANFGARKLMIRLPHGLPDPEAASPTGEEVKEAASNAHPAHRRTAPSRVRAEMNGQAQGGRGGFSANQLAKSQDLSAEKPPRPLPLRRTVQFRSCPLSHRSRWR